jgi:hypothetical protein
MKSGKLRNLGIGLNIKTRFLLKKYSSCKPSVQPTVDNLPAFNQKDDQDFLQG